jgi:hypothetical protein
MKTKFTFMLSLLLSISFRIFAQTDADNYWIKEDFSHFDRASEWIIEEKNYETYPNNISLTTTYANLEYSEYCAAEHNPGGNVLRIRGLNENGSAQFTVPNASKVTLRVTGKSVYMDRTVRIYRNNELVQSYYNVDRTVCHVFTDEINSQEPVTYKLTAGDELSTDPIVLYYVEVIKYGVTVIPEEEPKINYDSYWIYEKFSTFSIEEKYNETKTYLTAPNNITINAIWSNIEQGEACSSGTKNIRISGRGEQTGNIEFTVPDAKTVKIGVTGKASEHDREALIYRNDVLVQTITQLDKTECQEFFENINSETPLTYKIRAGSNLEKPIDITYILVKKNNDTGLTNLKDFDFSFYPNPVAETMYFSRTALQVTVLDLSGRQILKQQNINKINVNNLKSGVYLIKITTEKGIISNKFIKK